MTAFLLNLPLAVYSFKPPKFATDVSSEMVLLSWLMFIGAFFLLSKFVWRPILEALTRREYQIRSSLAQAENAAQQVAGIEEQKRRVQESAAADARRIREEAATQAKLIASRIESDARTAAEQIQNDAFAEIEQRKIKTRAALEAETFAMAAEIAGKILEKEISADAGRAFTDKMIHEVT